MDGLGYYWFSFGIGATHTHRWLRIQLLKGNGQKLYLFIHELEVMIPPLRFYGQIIHKKVSRTWVTSGAVEDQCLQEKPNAKWSLPHSKYTEVVQCATKMVTEQYFEDECGWQYWTEWTPIIMWKVDEEEPFTITEVVAVTGAKRPPAEQA